MYVTGINFIKHHNPDKNSSTWNVLAKLKANSNITHKTQYSLCPTCQRGEQRQISWAYPQIVART